jgi:hypothetical protein
MAAKRTTLRSSAGKKLYAVRASDGKFKDIQTYERAHAADLAKKSKSEKAVKPKAKAAPKAKVAVKTKAKAKLAPKVKVAAKAKAKK